jgi:hypothetical protein
VDVIAKRKELTFLFFFPFPGTRLIQRNNGRVYQEKKEKKRETPYSLSLNRPFIELNNDWAIKVRELPRSERRFTVPFFLSVPTNGHRRIGQAQKENKEQTLALTHILDT